MLTFFLFAIGAAFVQRVSGFGFGIFIMTVLPFMLPSYGEATALSGLLAMVTSAIIVSRHWRSIPWRKLLLILATFIVVSAVAVRLVAIADEGPLRMALGAVLVAASVWFFFFNERVRLPANVPVQVSMGTLSGFLGGLFGMQGPPAVLYFLAVERDKTAYMAMAQTYFLVGNGAMTIERAANGFITPTVGHMWLVGLAAVLIGTWLGSLVFRLLPVAVLRKVIYAYMGISGVIQCLV